MPDTSTPVSVPTLKQTRDTSPQTMATTSPQLLQSIYFNGFSVGISNADFAVRTMLENSELLELRMSFTTAKTLAQKLSEAVAKFEEVTDHKLMTTEDVLKALKEAGIRS